MAAESRLSLAIESGLVALPGAGRIAVLAARTGYDLSPLETEQCQVITGFWPDHDHFKRQGYDCAVTPEGRYAAAIVFLPRAKQLAHRLIFQAAQVTDGLVIVDGAKTDGVESVLKGCRKRAEVSAPLSKAHGKLFSFAAGPGFEDWAPEPEQKIEGGFTTAPGVFSADGIDPASRLLAGLLPAKLGAKVADLGGGWGYLSARILERPDIEELHLIEADHAALACARKNLPDDRMRFWWEDATQWQPQALLDAVVTNPPFHTGRAADPDLGRAFIRSAAGLLTPCGELWLVANRHLPYEAEMARYFAQVEEAGGDNRFKALVGARPARKKR